MDDVLAPVNRRCGVDPVAPAKELRQVGLTLIEDVNGSDIAKRYEVCVAGEWIGLPGILG